MNMRLRPYKPCDAATILSWIKDEETFRKRVTDRYPSYPITEKEMNQKYLECNGDCVEPDNFYPMTALDESGVVGHLIMRFTDAEKTVLRFGFVIVDASKRGKGYGKQMLRLALKYAFEILKVRKVTIGVLENNPGGVPLLQGGWIQGGSNGRAGVLLPHGGKCEVLGTGM